MLLTLSRFLLYMNNMLDVTYCKHAAVLYNFTSYHHPIIFLANFQLSDAWMIVDQGNRIIRIGKRSNIIATKILCVEQDDDVPYDRCHRH